MAVKLKVVNVRVTPDIHAFVVKEASREMMTISTWLCRQLARMKADREGKNNPGDKDGRAGR